MSSNNSREDRNRLWRKIRYEFRQACLLRREGKEVEASQILDKQLPGNIAAWARVSGLRDTERRTRLNDLFEEEQRRVDDIWLSQQIVLRQIRDILIPSLCLQVAEEVRDVLDTQKEQLEETLSKISRPPNVRALPARKPVEDSVEEMVEDRILKLPMVLPKQVRNAPRFDDLPEIIDQLIANGVGNQPVGSRLTALV